jgi:SAM-dependent methyltransferase
MSIQTLQRQYNDVAPFYDLDPQGVTQQSLDLAVEQLNHQHLMTNGAARREVLDLGMGTGLFLGKLKALGGDQLRVFGCDLAEGMVKKACRRIPDLIAEVDDAANLDALFPGQSFDLICTHFITGFVPMNVLAPKIWNRLELGGFWSLVGGTRMGFPVLQAKSENKFLRWVSGAGSQGIQDQLLNPIDQQDAERQLVAHGFEVCEAETFKPKVNFPNFDAFMEFGYQGGWFTPLIEQIGLNNAGAFTRFLFNRMFFPVVDHHDIAVVLARKVKK